MRRETFSTPGPVHLDLTVPAGEIELEAAATDETVIELEAIGGSSETAVEEARVELRGRGDGHEVIVEVRGPRFGFFSSVEVRLVVRAPEGASADVTTASADVHARGRFGDVEATAASGDLGFERVGGFRAKAASGDVEAAAVGGEASVSTASGDIEIGRLDGAGVLRTASGDVRVGPAGASLKVQTASGDQQVASVQEGRVELQTASGDIRVGIRPGSRLWIDARSASGEIDSELEIADTPTDEEGPLVELQAASMSGDVEIVRAKGS
jgi:DUF4097 and DUF4098 domain-containing protein YvlB